jgi:hypothetical protein
MSDPQLKDEARDAAAHLSKDGRDGWIRSVARRLDVLGKHTGPGFVSAIRASLSVADANHVHSYVNFLRGMVYSPRFSWTHIWITSLGSRSR